jgi:cytosine/adenosine deaminase-related metal-dependent hydrolase
MTPADVAAATAAATSELLLTGATTTVDHFYLIPHCDFAYIEAEVEAARQSGMRLHLVRGSMTSLEGDLAVELTQQLGPRAGGIIDDRSRVLQALNETIRRFHDTSRGSLLTVAVGPTTPTYDDFEFLSAIGELAREADVGIHMHVHPQPSERALCQKRFGKTPFEFLQSAGLLTPRTWFAHCTRINESDVRLLSAHNVGMAHCARMILRLGARIPPLHLVRAHGMRVAVGVDGAASNDSGSMLGEMRVALLLHRLFDGGGEVPPETWLTPYDLLLMNTRSAAEMIGRTDIGQIAPGYGADVIAFDMRGVEFAGAMLDPLSGLLLAGADTRASLTMVAGVILVREGRLVEADEREIRATVDTASARLLERASASTGTDYASWSLGAAA